MHNLKVMESYVKCDLEFLRVELYFDMVNQNSSQQTTVHVAVLIEESPTAT